jgi:hypothetical protein
MTPYVVTITTSRQIPGSYERAPGPEFYGAQPRCTVDTLEEARALVAEHYERSTGKPCPACFELCADGGTAGPLSDGTVIEVAPLERESTEAGS